MGWKAEVKTKQPFGGDDWASNDLVFPTEEQASDYAQDLMWRWTQVTEWRTREVPDVSATHVYIENELAIKVDEPTKEALWQRPTKEDDDRD